MSGQKSPWPTLPMQSACAIPCPHPVWQLLPPSGFTPERCEPAALGGEPARTCSWPRMMTPWGLMACQEARFSPAARCSPSWYADHLPSRVVHATQMWCQALSFRLSGSWATFARNARAWHLVGLPEDPLSSQRLTGQVVHPYDSGIPNSTDIWMCCFSLSKPALASHPPHPPASTLSPVLSGPPPWYPQEHCFPGGLK